MLLASLKLLLYVPTAADDFTGFLSVPNIFAVAGDPVVAGVPAVAWLADVFAAASRFPYVPGLLASQMLVFLPLLASLLLLAFVLVLVRFLQLLAYQLFLMSLLQLVT